VSTLQRAWLRRGPLAGLLWPLSLVYRAASVLHGRLLASGQQAIERLPVPVIVVGNVIAGGAGKTPVVLALLQHLRRRRLRAGVVSRGYGRSSQDCREVRPQDNPAFTGDEPLLLRRNGGLPVFVARKRVHAARALLAAYPGTQVIVSDDGLQHHALARDIEICVFDRRGIGNGLLLPAGPLREPWPRPVDLVLRDADTPGIEGHVLRRTLATEAVRGDGARRRLSDLRGTPLVALAGIAAPDAFFDMLRAAGLTLTATYGLPDHHDFVHLPAAIRPDACLVCTEKDAVKLWDLRPDAWAVPLQVEIPPAFWEALDRLLDARLSSAHGSAPA
jgi:tetraacyldisaccharide 4'-kinase